MLIYTDVIAKTIDDLEFQLNYNKNYQFEKFKNGIETINWNNKEIIIENDLYFVDDCDLTKYVNENYIKNTVLCLKLFNFKQLQFTNQTNQDIYDSILELEEDINNQFYINLIERTKKQLSSTKSCNNCKSIIKIQNISHHKCPVCNDEKFLFTDTDKQSYESKINRLNKHKENYNDKYAKYKDKNLKKVEKYLKNQLLEDEMLDIYYKWIIISDEIIIDELSEKLINLKVNSYNLTKENEEIKQTIEKFNNDDIDENDEILNLFSKKIKDLKKRMEDEDKEELEVENTTEEK